jgi:uncharacterized membrane protein
VIPEPLHPAVVHFPIVLAFLLPIFALGALWAIRRGVGPSRAWALPVALAAALAASAWVALETGEDQEERVEAVVSEEALGAHEESAERFLVLSGLVLVVAGAGLLGGTVGAAGRILATAGSVVVLVAGFSVGRAGGELVYRHGAAQPYVAAASAGAVGPSPATGTGGYGKEHEHEDED